MTDIPTPEEEYVLKQYELIAPCIEEGVSHKTRAAETDVDRKTISRLVSKFKAGGIDALCRKTRSDKGCARVSFNTFKTDGKDPGQNPARLFKTSFEPLFLSWW